MYTNMQLCSNIKSVCYILYIEFLMYFKMVTRCCNNVDISHGIFPIPNTIMPMV